MSELREPLEHVTTCYKAFGEAFCALVDAVGLVEPEDTDATIRKERDMFEQMWKDTAAILGDTIKAHDKTIAEAQAEIERLRQHVTFFDTDAALGRMLRGMPNCTRLVKGSRYYWAEKQNRDDRTWHRVQAYLRTDPAEALRSIQASE